MKIKFKIFNKKQTTLLAVSNKIYKDNECKVYVFQKRELSYIIKKLFTK